MPTKQKPASRLKSSILESAAGLHRLGFIDKRRMLEYEALCLPSVPRYDSKKVKALRSKHNISQSVLAAVLNTSVSTVRKWEAGDKNPSGPSLKLLDLVERKGIEALL